MKVDLGPDEVAIAPLQRVAERVADKTTPHATGDAAYIEFRKLQIYSDALEAMDSASVLSQADRAVLARMRGCLNMNETAAAQMGSDVRAARAGVA